MLKRFEKFIYDISEIDLYWHRIATAQVKEYGLKGNYVVYFAVLNKADEGLTATELAAKCGKDKADVSRDISVLEKRGYVQRIKTGESGYRALIALTDSGKTIARQIVKKAVNAVAAIGGDLTREERECFYNVLDRITENMQIYCDRDLK